MAKILNQSQKFHRKIENLLQRSGFNIVSSDFYQKGPDIIISAEGHRIIVQCKHSEKDLQTFRKLDSIIDEYSRKRRKWKASAAILVLGGYKLPRIDKSDLLKKEKVIIWSNKDIEYYNKISKSLKSWARFPMLSDFGINKDSNKTIKLPAMKVNQGKYTFLVFQLDPETLLKIGDVFRRERNTRAYQRMVEQRRVKEIGDFIKSSSAVFPTNIVCAFNSKVTYKKGIIEMPIRYGSLLIIDGQHRLYGFCHSDNERIKKFELICTAFNINGIENSKLTETDQARLFRNLNEKSKKVSKELIIALSISLKIADRQTRVIDKLRKRRYFQNKVKTIDSKGDIHITTFVETPPSERLMKDNGLISKFYKNNGSHAPDDFYLCILDKYFHLVSRIFKEAWEDPKSYILATDRGIRGLLRLCEDVIEYSNGLKNIDKAEAALKGLVGVELRSKELKRKYAGEAGADELVGEWRDHIRKTLPDFATKKRQLIYEHTIEIDNIKRTEAFLQSSFKNLEPFDGEIKGIKGMLAYVDKTTFDYINNLLPTNCSNVKLLVSNIDDKSACLKTLEELRSRGRDFEVYSMKYGEDEQDGREKEALHKRWIAGKNIEILLDNDLKKKSLVNKEGSIRILGDVSTSNSVKTFDNRWLSTVMSGIGKTKKELRVKRVFPI